MQLSAYLNVFVHDQKLKAVLVLIAIDLVLGIAAAVQGGQFNLSYVADFLRADVLGKVFPWFVLYAGGLTTSTEVAGIDLSQVATVAWAAVVLALSGSLIKSLSDFGVTLPKTLGGHA